MAHWTADKEVHTGLIKLEKEERKEDRQTARKEEERRKKKKKSRIKDWRREGRINRWIEGFYNGLWMDERMKGWKDEWIDGRIVGIERYKEERKIRREKKG